MTKQHAGSNDKQTNVGFRSSSSSWIKFRFLFYIVMAYNWYEISNTMIPCNFWQKAFKYYHTFDVCPPTKYWVLIIQLVGILVCLLATVKSRIGDVCALLFAIMQNCYVFSYTSNFVNHDYLFGLLAILLVCCMFSSQRRNNNNIYNIGWLHALRGQICIVYFYAALWKMITPAWLDGRIVKSIFISFEQQGVASGVPWSQLEKTIPNLFILIAWSGLILDAMLAITLLFSPIGSWTQQVGVLFHGFTAFTMAQRIGYAFPLTMLASGFLFMPVSGEKTDEKDKKKQSKSMRKSHTGWMWFNWKRHPLVSSWLLVQCILPMRMPIVSNGRYPLTGEGYRFSWTMMLHSRASNAGSGINFFTLRVYCNDKIFPITPQYPHHLDVNGYPITQRIGRRGLALLNAFPRQLSFIGYKASQELKEMGACPSSSVYGHLFLAVDGGPYHRIVDPEQDLVETHASLVGRNAADTMIGSFLDEAPIKDEFILKDVGSYWDDHELPETKEGDEWLTVVDRFECLARDPIVIFGQAIEFIVLDTPGPLFCEICYDLEQTNCLKEQIPYQLGQMMQPVRLPPMAVIKFHSTNEPAKILKQQDSERACRSAKEDVVIQFRRGPVWNPNAQPQTNQNQDSEAQQQAGRIGGDSTHHQQRTEL